MILLALVGLLIVGWIFSIVVKIPIRIYSALKSWIRITLIFSSCSICKKQWADLSSDEGAYSHKTRTKYNKLVGEDVKWVRCSECGGAGAESETTRAIPMDTGNGQELVDMPASGATCFTCRGTGEEKDVSPIYEERTRITKYYDYVISCGDCAGKYTVQDSEKPTFPTNKRTIFVANIINQGLVKGMLAGLVLALSGTIIWGVVELVSRGFSFPTLADWVMGLNILLGTAIIALLIAIPIGAIWGTVMYSLSSFLTRFAENGSYLHAALSGGFSLALIIAFANLLSMNFNTDFNSFLYAILGYLIIICVGAAASCAAKPMLNYLEKTL